MKVHVAPIPQTLSRAMWRVGNALERYAPDGVDIVKDVTKADVEVLHVIGLDALAYSETCGRDVVTIQYCFKSAMSAADTADQWRPLWERSRATWSYYNLESFGVPRFYCAPLGIDEAFTVDEPAAVEAQDDRWKVLSSGYVNGPGAEAIAEFTEAATRCGLVTRHLGPPPVGMTAFPKDWHSIHGCTDEELAREYQACKFVSGLRFMEGFEFPVIEGLSNGARPIVFDRPETRRWFEGLAVFVPESQGEDLVRWIETAMYYARPVNADAIAEARRRFDWRTIAAGFWEKVLNGQ